MATDVHGEGRRRPVRLRAVHTSASRDSSCRAHDGEDDLIDGASIVGGATLVALLADGAASLSF